MNLDSFYSYIKNPATLNVNSVNELYEIIERYPYFQTARLLYLKNLQILNDYRFNDELKTVSAYAVNRKILYELVKESENQKNINFNVPISTEIEPIIENNNVEITNNKCDDVLTNTIIEKHVVGEVKSEIVEPKTITEQADVEIFENTNIPQFTNKEFNIKEEVSETVISQEITLVNNNKIEVDNPQIIQPTITIQNVERNIENIDEKKNVVIVTEKTINPETKIILEKDLIEVKNEVVEIIDVKNEYIENVAETPIKESIADKILKKVAEVKAHKAQYSQKTEEQRASSKIVEANLQVKEFVEPKIIEQVEIEKIVNVENSISEKYSQEKDVTAENNQNENIKILNTEDILNLQQFSNEQVSEKQTFEITAYDLTQIDEKQQLVENAVIDLPKEKMSFEQWINYVSEKSKNVENQKKQEQILESFIKSEPKIQPINNTIIDNSKELIKNNLVDEFSLVSETLADIYVNQKLFDNAIIMFEKLALKYPEKNIYFANRILEIKSKFNNQ